MAAAEESQRSLTEQLQLTFEETQQNNLTELQNLNAENAQLKKDTTIHLQENKDLSAKLAELTAESAAVKEHAKIQMQKAIEKIKALTVTVDDKGQEVAQLQQNEARLTEEMAALREKEVGLAEEIQQLRENEVRLSSSSGEVAAALQVRVAELEQSEVSLGQQLAAVRADTQDQIQALQGTYREGCWLGCDGGR